MKRRGVVALCVVIPLAGSGHLEVAVTHISCRPALICSIFLFRNHPSLLPNRKSRYEDRSVRRIPQELHFVILTPESNFPLFRYVCTRTQPTFVGPKNQSFPFSLVQSFPPQLTISDKDFPVSAYVYGCFQGCDPRGHHVCHVVRPL